MTYFKREKQLFSCLVIITFFITNTLSPAPAAYAQPAAHLGFSLNNVESVNPLKFIDIPAEWGHVTDLVMASKQPSPLFVHIQESHSNYSAQKNIKNILQLLNKDYGINLVLVEGAGNELKPDLFNFFPKDPELQSAIADALVKAGQLTGVELFLIDQITRVAGQGPWIPAQTVRRPEGWGMENPKAYARNRQAFKTVFEGQKLGDAFLDGFYREWRKQAGFFLNKDLREFILRSVAFDEEEIPLKDWLETLRTGSLKALSLDLGDTATQVKWPILVRYFRLRSIERKINAAALEQEKKIFLTEINGTKVESETALNKDQENARYVASVIQDVKTLLAAHENRNLPPFKTRFAFEKLMEQLPEDFSFTPYPNLRLHIQQLILLSELQGSRLQNEIKNLTRQIIRAFAQNDNENRHIDLLREYQLLKKLFHLELSREDLLKVQAEKIAPQKLLNALEANVRKMPEGAKTDGILNPGSNLRGVTDLFQFAMEFYEGAVERENYMMRNAISRMREKNESKAVLVTGGFHTNGFKRKALQSGSSYVQITPSIDEIRPEDKENYTRALLGDESALRTLRSASNNNIAASLNCDISFIYSLPDGEKLLASRRAEMRETGRQVIASTRPEQRSALFQEYKNKVDQIFSQASTNGRPEIRATPEETSPAKAKILVVDDDGSVLQALRWELGDQGYDVVTAGSVEEALEAYARAKRDKEPFADLIIADWEMQKGDDGFDLAKAVGKDSEIIFFSSVFARNGALFSDRVGALLEELKKEGVSFLSVPKSADMDELFAAVKQVLKSRKDESETDAILRPEIRTTPQETSAAKAKILLVDDAPFIRQELEMDLIDAGYEVVTAGNVKEALAEYDEARSNEEPFDLLIADWEMPKPNEGAELAKIIRKTDRRIGIIFSSSIFEEDGTILSSYLEEAGPAVKELQQMQIPFFVFPKPMDFDKMVETVDQIIENQKKEIEPAIMRAETRFESKIPGRSETRRFTVAKNSSVKTLVDILRATLPEMPFGGLRFTIKYYDANGLKEEATSKREFDHAHFFSTLSKVLDEHQKIHKEKSYVYSGHIISNENRTTDILIEVKDSAAVAKSRRSEVRGAGDSWSNRLLEGVGKFDTDAQARETTPNWHRMNVIAGIILGQIDSQPTAVSEELILDIAPSKFETLGIAGPDVDVKTLLDRLVKMGLLKKEGHAYNLAVPREIFEIKTNQIHIIKKRLEAHLAALQKKPQTGTRYLLQFLIIYDNAIAQWPRFPVEASWPFLKAVSLLTKEERAYLLDFIKKNRPRLTNVPLAKKIILMLDPEPVKNWLPENAPNLEGRSIYYISPETWFAAGGLGRVGQFHTIAAKELIGEDAELITIEPRYRYRFDAQGQIRCDVDYTKLPVPVEGISEKPNDVVTLRLRKGSINDRRDIPVAFYRGSNQYGIQAHLMEDLPGQEGDDPFYTKLLYRYGSEYGTAEWWEFAEFLGKGALIDIIKTETEKKKRLGDQYKPSVIWPNDGQSAFVTVFKRILDEMAQKSPGETKKLLGDSSFELKDLLKALNEGISLQSALVHGTTHTFRNRPSYGIGEDKIDGMRINQKWRYLFRRIYKTDPTSGLVRASDSANGVAAMHVQGIEHLDPETRILAITNGDDLAASSEVFRAIFAKETFQKRFPDADPWDPRPAEVSEAKKIAKQMIATDPRFQKLDPEFAYLDSGKMVISTSGRLVTEKAGLNRAFTDENIEYLVRQGVQVIIFGNIQAGYESREMYDHLREVQERVNKIGPGRLIVATGWGIPEQRLLLAATDAQVNDSDPVTEAAGFSETDAAANAALEITLPAPEGIYQQQGAILDFEEPGSGNTVLATEESAAGYRRAFTRTIRKYKSNGLNFASYQVASKRLSSVLNARLTAAAYLTEFSRSFERKEDPLGSLVEYVSGDEGEGQFFKNEWLRYELIRTLENSKEEFHPLKSKNVHLRAFAASDISAVGDVNVVAIETGVRDNTRNSGEALLDDGPALAKWFSKKLGATDTDSLQVRNATTGEIYNTLSLRELRERGLYVNVPDDVYLQVLKFTLRGSTEPEEGPSTKQSLFYDFELPTKDREAISGLLPAEFLGLFKKGADNIVFWSPGSGYTPKEKAPKSYYQPGFYAMVNKGGGRLSITITSLPCEMIQDEISRDQLDGRHAFLHIPLKAEGNTLVFGVGFGKYEKSSGASGDMTPATVEAVLSYWIEHHLIDFARTYGFENIKISQHRLSDSFLSGIGFVKVKEQREDALPVWETKITWSTKDDVQKAEDFEKARRMIEFLWEGEPEEGQDDEQNFRSEIRQGKADDLEAEWDKVGIGGVDSEKIVDELCKKHQPVTFINDGMESPYKKNEKGEPGEINAESDIVKRIRDNQVIYLSSAIKDNRDYGKYEENLIKMAMEKIGPALGYVRKEEERKGNPRQRKIFILSGMVNPGTSKAVYNTIKWNAKPDQFSDDYDFDVVFQPDFSYQESQSDATVEPIVAFGLLKEDDSKDQGSQNLTKTILEKTFEGYYKDKKIMFMGVRSAEMAKQMLIIYLAAKLAHFDEVAEVARRYGADLSAATFGAGLDKRIRTLFTNPSLGFGGRLFTHLRWIYAQQLYKAATELEKSSDQKIEDHKKEIDQKVQTVAERMVGREQNIESALKDLPPQLHLLFVIATILKVNKQNILDFFNLIVREYGRMHGEGALRGKKVALLSIGYRSNVKKITASPALLLIQKLVVDEGVNEFYIVDSAANENELQEALEEWKAQQAAKNPRFEAVHFEFSANIYSAAESADLVIIPTDSNEELKNINIQKLGAALNGKPVFDGMNIFGLRADGTSRYGLAAVREAGINLFGVGRIPLGPKLDKKEGYHLSDSTVIKTVEEYEKAILERDPGQQGPIGFRQKSVAVVGGGYVGLVTAANLAALGHKVHVVDIKAKQKEIDALNAPETAVPIYEPGLQEMIKEGKEKGLITFSTDIAEAVKDSTIVYLAVGTPSQDSGEVDLKYILKASEDVGDVIKKYGGSKAIVIKSTVTPNTFEEMEKHLESKDLVLGKDYALVSNPEFLREGQAIEDVTEPDRTVLGFYAALSSEDRIWVEKELLELWYPLMLKYPHQVLLTDTASSTIVKYLANSFLAISITLSNIFAAAADWAAADFMEVRKPLFADERIGRNAFLAAGIGYGGSCFPKDVLALLFLSLLQTGHALPLIYIATGFNNHYKKLVVTRAVEKAAAFPNAARPLEGKRVIMLGMAFKPDTDDMREASGVYVLHELLKKGASKVILHDPILSLPNAPAPEVIKGHFLDYLFKAFYEDEDFQKVFSEKFRENNDILKIKKQPELTEAEYFQKHYFVDNFAERVVFEPDFEKLGGADIVFLVTEWEQYKGIDLSQFKQENRRFLVADGRNLFYNQRAQIAEYADYIGIGTTFFARASENYINRSELRQSDANAFLEILNDLKRYFPAKEIGTLRLPVILDEVKLKTPEEFFRFNQEKGGGSEKGVRRVTEKIMDGIISILADAVGVAQAVYLAIVPAVTKVPEVQQVDADAAKRVLGLAPDAEYGFVLGLDLALGEGKGMLAIAKTSYPGSSFAILVKDPAQVADVEKIIRDESLEDRVFVITDAKSARSRLLKPGVSIKGMISSDELMLAEELKAELKDDLIVMNKGMRQRFLAAAGQLFQSLADKIAADFALAHSA